MKSSDSKFKVSSKKLIWFFSILCHTIILLILSIFFVKKQISSNSMSGTLPDKTVEHYIEFTQPQKELRKKTHSHLFTHKNNQAKVKPKIPEVSFQAPKTPKIKETWQNPIEEAPSSPGFFSSVATLSYNKTSTIRFSTPTRIGKKAHNNSQQSLKSKKDVKKKKSVTIANKIIPPRAIFAPKPRYPRRAQRLKLQGKVILQVKVLRSGLPGRIKVIYPSHQLLNTCAVQTLKKWRFLPAKQGKKNISAWIEIPLKFVTAH